MEKDNLLSKVESIRLHLNRQIIGQEHLIDALLISLLCEGHLLIEGLPGLAKTRAVKSFSEAVSTAFGRIQFTPDMLPSDVTGNDIYDPSTHTFRFQEGPVFTNILLADEINRAPAKVQAALLEAMQEKQITVNGKTYRLPSPFVVMATQNPQEQEGTFLLPEAQKDRFLMNVVLSYPSEQDEIEVLRMVRKEKLQKEESKVVSCSVEDVWEMQAKVRQVYVSEVIERYIVKLVQATRMESDAAGQIKELEGVIVYGAGTRAALALDLCARACAWLSGRNYVTGDDVKYVAKDVLRHRMKLSLRAVHEGWTMEKVLDELLTKVSLA